MKRLIWNAFSERPIYDHFCVRSLVWGRLALFLEVVLLPPAPKVQMNCGSEAMLETEPET